MIKQKRCSTFILISILIVLVYSNTFQASWHFDDYSNILGFSNIQIDNIFPKTLYATLFEDNKLYRPIPRLTFALNWYWGGGGVFGFHVVNILIHIFTAYFLFLTNCLLLKSPNMENRFHENSTYFIAFLSTVVWAVHPIQIQAVTYIVQRMASMATLFYIGGVYFYIRGRNSPSKSFRQLIFFFCCLFSYFLAFFSKENAVMLPASLILVEIIFYRRISIISFRKYLKSFISYWVIFLFSGFLFFLIINLDVFISYLDRGYAIRPFSAWERLLTEPRVIFLYLSQLFYPIPEKFSFQHYVELSTSLFHPWTTFPSLIGVVGLFMWSLLQIAKKPLIAFSILFFFLNHLIESSIIPLELVYEHRNYLPSLFLFLPFSAGLYFLVDHFQRQEKQILSFAIISSIVIFILCLGLGTYMRNMVWRNEKVFWEDVIEKAPQIARGYQNLATSHYVKIKDYDRAIRLYEMAIGKYDPKPFSSDLASLRNIMKAHFHQKSYDKTIQIAKKIIETIENHSRSESQRYFKNSAYNFLIQAYIETKNWKNASRILDVMLEIEKSNPDYLFLKGYVLLQRDIPELKSAITYLKSAKKEAEKHSVKTGKSKLGEISFYLGVGYNRLGRHEKAFHLFKDAYRVSPSKMIWLLSIIENRIMAQDKENSDQYLHLLLSKFTLSSILNVLKEKDHSVIDFSAEIILPKLKEGILQDIASISAL